MSNQQSDSLENPEKPNDFPLASWFLGPKAEHGDLWLELFEYIFRDYVHWRRNYFPADPMVISRERRRGHAKWIDNLNTNLDYVLNRLKAHFPFYSPRYLAHMLSEQTLPSVMGYFAAMLYNPNNVTDEAAPVTVKFELEVGKMVAEMLGYNPKRAWAHITSGGTVANIEALWVARTVQFIPFVIRDYCRKYKIDYMVKTANMQQAYIRDLSDQELIGFRPNESIFLIRKLAKLEIEQIGRSPDVVFEKINNFVKANEFNSSVHGIVNVCSKLKLRPVILCSTTAHYSLKKAANILGYGEDCIELVPINSQFRMNSDVLKESLTRIKNDKYVAAVIGIVGTTEEGAVDPIHKIKFIRDELCNEYNRSFWFHIDAAWGGYIRSIFCGLELPEREKGKRELKDICDDYGKAINAHEKFSLKPNKESMEEFTGEIWWNEYDIYAAFLAMKDADSITVDPHKMGYTPYPSGIVAFRNGLVTELLSQKANYISDEKGGLSSIDEIKEINAVGPFILEGSKPGAAAASCWLAHKTIPLTVHGHGKIIRTSVLNARKLTRYLNRHKYIFEQIDKEVIEENKENKEKTRFNYPFTFFPLLEPDTNVVCFVTLPMAWKDNTLIAIDVDLLRVNELNEAIYKKLSISAQGFEQKMPYEQAFFVSRTTFDNQEYRAQDIAPLLSRLRIPTQQYCKHGLFVLRSTIMNPLYFTALNEGKDYLLDFVKHLHKVTREDLIHIYWRH